MALGAGAPGSEHRWGPERGGRGDGLGWWMAAELRKAWRRVLGVLRADGVTLAAVLVMVASCWFFFEISDEALEEGGVDEIDVWVLERVYEEDGPVGPAWLEAAALDVTGLGSATVLVLVVLVAGGYLALVGRHGFMWLLVVASVVGQGLSSGLKVAFGRERPDEALHLEAVSTLSYPSGHATLGAVVYLTLGAVLAATRVRWRERIFILGVAALVACLIGVSRVYIGVHYPTDVLGGWSLGLAWALLCLTAARWVERRRAAGRGVTR